MLLLLGICWGSVPVNPANLDRKKRIFVSLAGPLANLGLFAIGVIGSVIFTKFGNTDGRNLTAIFATLNMALFMINIAPVPGFDGGSVFTEFVGQEKLYSSELGKGFMLASFLVLFYLIDYIFHWANTATVKAVAVLGKLLL
jgi:Zn-dependent protease